MGFFNVFSLFDIFFNHETFVINGIILCFASLKVLIIIIFFKINTLTFVNSQHSTNSKGDFVLKNRF